METKFDKLINLHKDYDNLHKWLIQNGFERGGRTMFGLQDTMQFMLNDGENKNLIKQPYYGPIELYTHTELNFQLNFSMECVTEAIQFYLLAPCGLEPTINSKLYTIEEAKRKIELGLIYYHRIKVWKLLYEINSANKYVFDIETT